MTSKLLNTNLKIKWTIRECTAAGVWIYVLLQLGVFDVDVYILDRIAPGLRWILPLKAFVIMAVIALAWIALGRNGFRKTALYIGAYPAILLLWQLPKQAFRRWPIVIASAPVVYRFVTTFRTTFLLYTLAALSSLIVILGTDKGFLSLALTVLIVFKAAHLFRSFKKAYGPSAFAGISLLLGKLRESVEKGIFDGQQTIPAQGTHPPSSKVNQPPNASGLYLLGRLAEIVNEKVQLAAKSRHYDLYLITGWLYSAALTCLVFAFEYLALQRIDSSSFRFAEGANFWAFLGLSLGALTPAKASVITPVSPIANLLYYSEAGCGVLILVILVFTVLTAAREAFKSDIEAFGEELKITADAIDRRITQVYSMTLTELEIVLLKDKEALILINLLRKARGLPELGLPPSQSYPIATLT